MFVSADFLRFRKFWFDDVMAAILYETVGALSRLYLNSDFLQIFTRCSLHSGIVCYWKSARSRNIFDPKRRTAYWSGAILSQKPEFVCLFLFQLYSPRGYADFDENPHKYSLGCLPVPFFSDFENFNLMTSWRPFCKNRWGTLTSVFEFRYSSILHTM